MRFYLANMLIDSRTGLSFPGQTQASGIWIQSEGLLKATGTAGF